MIMNDKIQSGSFLVLNNAHGVKELLVENLGGSLLLAESRNPYFRMHVDLNAITPAAAETTGTFADSYPQAFVSFRNNSPQMNNMFTLKRIKSNLYALVTSIRKDRNSKSDSVFAVGFDVLGNYYTQMLETLDFVSNHGENCFLFQVSFTTSPSAETGSGTCVTGAVPHYLTAPLYSFEKWQLRRFVMEGYLHIPEVANMDAVRNCLAVLNHELGVPGRVMAGGVQPQLGKLGGELSNCAAVRAVFHGRVEGDIEVYCILYEMSANVGYRTLLCRHLLLKCNFVLGVINALLGANGCEKNHLSAQIAFRFPECNKGDVGVNFGKFLC